MSRAGFTRAEILRLAGGAGAAGLFGTRVHAEQSGEKPAMQTRIIPSSGEKLPVIGVGTWQGFDVGADAVARKQLTQVLATLFNAGGSVIDSSPMYGTSEDVAGTLVAGMGARSKAFIATKVWTRGREAGVQQINRSMQLLRADKLDLMQIHNLLDWRVHLATLRDLKSKGRIRYLGVTHYTSSAYHELEAVMREQQLDFVQVNYSADDRAAEQRILPLAAERGMAVLINLPFGGGGLLRRLRSKPLPDWASEIGCASWAQILLRFVIGHPAVTCVIPGTANPDHMRDNAAAGIWPILDDAARRRIAAEIN
ncbi:MAG: aldo/keto reductase [Methylobacteriaceae bacterium]|nr:aldo/keto reductase [Methylobacteriaceae bacterium]